MPRPLLGLPQPIPTTYGLSGDPFWAQTTLLLHMDGANASTTFTDSSPYKNGNMTAASGAKLSTAQSKFGGASALFNGTSDYITVPSGTSASGAFGTGDFTIECQVRFSTVPTANYGGIANTHTSPTAAPSTAWFFAYRVGYGLYLGQHSVANAIYGAWTPVAGTWYHVAVCRSRGTVRLFVDGTMLSTTNVGSGLGSINFSLSGPLAIGMNATPYYFAGNIDEFRLTRAARYAGSFTPPTAAFPDP